MKRLIFLKININQIDDKLSVNKFFEEKKKLTELTIKQFKAQIKSLPQVKISKDLFPEAQVIIEFPDDQYQIVYEALCKMDTVEVIDVALPKGED